VSYLAGRTRDPSAVCWHLPVPLPWLSSWGGPRQGWAGRLCFRPSSSSEPLELAEGQCRSPQGRSHHCALQMVAHSRFEGHQVSLPELGAERVEVFSGKQGLNTEIL